jgi:hypothetical protein
VVTGRCRSDGLGTGICYEFYASSKSLPIIDALADDDLDRPLTGYTTRNVKNSGSWAVVMG